MLVHTFMNSRGMWDDVFRKTLISYYEGLKAKNSRLSLREFAKKMDVSPGTMSEIIRRSPRWKLTSKRALELLDKMEISPGRKNHLRVLMGEKNSNSMRAIEERNCDLLLAWEFYPVLAAFDQEEGALWAPQELAARLGLSAQKVDSMIEELLRRNYLVRNGEGIFRTDSVWEMVDGTDHAKLKKYHESNLQLAQRALARASSHSDFSTLTFRGSKAAVEQVRQEIRELQVRIAAMMDGEDADDIYQVSVSLFPIDFRE